MKPRTTGRWHLPRTNRNIPEPNPVVRVGQTAGTLPPSWKPSIVVAVPLPVVIVSVVVFNLILPPPAQFNKGLAFEPPFLNAILYTIFLALTSFIVAYISFKSYIQNGWTFLVLLGSGALAWGSTSLLAGWLTNLSTGPNPAITISTLAHFLPPFSTWLVVLGPVALLHKRTRRFTDQS